MKRLTTENPGDNMETALNLFYIKDHETWVRGGGPGPEYADVSLFDFTRQIVKARIPGVDLPADNDNLSMMMAEWLFDEPDTAEGVIALLYTAAWSYAELRHRLAAIEDTLGDEYDLEQLREILRAGQNGTLKVGDKVYQADDVRTYVSTINRVIYDTENIAFDERVIGKTVFLTREAAEAALAKGAIK